MSWLRTPNGGYVDPLEVVAIDKHRTDRDDLCNVTLRNGAPFEIDDTPDRVWHAVMDARRNT